MQALKFVKSCFGHNPARHRVQTKERCALWLENWGKLEEGDAVYHIISPAAGGKVRRMSTQSGAHSDSLWKAAARLA